MDKLEFASLISSRRKNMQTKVPEELLTLVQKELADHDDYASLTVFLVDQMCAYLVRRGIMEDDEKALFMEKLRVRKTT